MLGWLASISVGCVYQGCANRRRPNQKSIQFIDSLVNFDPIQFNSLTCRLNSIQFNSIHFKSPSKWRQSIQFNSNALQKWRQSIQFNSKSFFFCGSIQFNSIQNRFSMWFNSIQVNSAQLNPIQFNSNRVFTRLKSVGIFLFLAFFWRC